MPTPCPPFQPEHIAEHSRENMWKIKEGYKVSLQCIAQCKASAMGEKETEKGSRERDIKDTKTGKYENAIMKLIIFHSS